MRETITKFQISIIYWNGTDQVIFVGVELGLLTQEGGEGVLPTII